MSEQRVQTNGMIRVVFVHQRAVGRSKKRCPESSDGGVKQRYMCMLAKLYIKYEAKKEDGQTAVEALKMDKNVCLPSNG